MLKILFELCEEKEMASFYTDEDNTGKFHFGTVTAVNEREIALEKITPDGDYDGITVMSTERVIRVERGGLYAEKMHKLCCGKTLPDIDYHIDNDNIMMSFMRWNLTAKEVLSIELIHSGYNDIIGRIDSIEDDQCIIKQIDEYGFDDGISYVMFDNITQITCLSQDEKRIMRLAEYGLK